MRGWLSRSRGFWDCRDRDQALGWPDRLRLGPIAPSSPYTTGFLVQIENGQVLDGKAVIEGLRAKVRSQRGSWEHFQQVLARVPDAEPEEFDRL